MTAEVEPGAIAVYSVVKETCKIDWEEMQAYCALEVSGTLWPLSHLLLTSHDHKRLIEGGLFYI